MPHRKSMAAVLSVEYKGVKVFPRLLSVSKSYGNSIRMRGQIITRVKLSTCNLGMYEADFGWGKPIWVSLGGNMDPMVMNILIYLLDTRSGGGIEAWVNLSAEDMAEFERDPELYLLSLLWIQVLFILILLVSSYSELSSTVYPEAPILSDDPTPAPPGPTLTPSGSSLPEPSCFGSTPNEPLILPSSPPTELPAPPLSDDSPPRRSTRAAKMFPFYNIAIPCA
ncbi:hypothetical protein RHGRI_037081 [Rhododendron griersonianum]|uniref:Uncharacterized protein n=1 Tax=Rhododendron griersonianum TaxID=479676 RepID=A0AAV6HUS5_9ERIC|nr:hypothetical protein RHGRI_037081 [Rhododendron griersonianum]